MKELRFTLDGAPVVVRLDAKITKEALYGGVETVVEKDGRRLAPGYLLPDGQMLRRGQIAYAALDPEGTPVDPPRMLRDDEVAEQEPSSFDRETPLRAVPLTDLVGFATSDVYAVEPAGLAAGLYETAFNYRKSFLAKEALLLVKSDTEAYLLVGARKQLNFLGRQVAYEFFDAAEGADEGVDPLDFSIM